MLRAYENHDATLGGPVPRKNTLARLNLVLLTFEAEQYLNGL